MAGSAWTIVLVTLTFVITLTDQNIRHKRDILADHPRILTESGHLVFATGTNHNITFRSSQGGGVFVDNEDLKSAVSQIKLNKVSISGIQQALGSGTRNVTNRLATLEGQIQPLAFLNTQLNTLTNSVTTLRQSGDAHRLSTNTRLNVLERQVTPAQNISSIRTQFSALEIRVRNLERTVRTVASRSQQITTITRRVTTLETTVARLQNLLTVNECLSNPCANGGTCTDMYGGFFCRCQPSWQGPTCTEDVNECAMYAGTTMGCKNGATCLNSYGGFSCQCPPDWHGIHCSERHNDCDGALHSELCGHGSCINEKRTSSGIASYRCICDNGWTTSSNGPQCNTDINECETGIRCSTDPLVQCINERGSFRCGFCPPGYTGNGYTCADVNECAINNGGCSLYPHVQCLNTRGSRVCGPCPAGYQGDGTTCTYIGVCAVSNGGCHPLATCQDDSGGFGIRCICPAGYVGAGNGPNGCQPQSSAGSCASRPCQNGGTCLALGSSLYVCSCAPGFSGQNCSITVNPCSSSPCQNGGTCSQQTQSPGYICTCAYGYTGFQCERPTAACDETFTSEVGTVNFTSNQYQNSATCQWRITTSSNKVIRVNFVRFNLEHHSNCNYDYLDIYDGPTAASYKIGRFCGSTSLPMGGVFNSTTNQLYFYFQSDVSGTYEGFEFQWTSNLPSCGGHLTGSDYGNVTSPGYPNNYPHDRDCSWVITVSPGNSIILTFAHLSIERHSNCSYDFLEIKDGETENAPVLGRYCTSQTLQPVRTSGPNAFLRFHSDSSLSDTGFLMTYAAVSAGQGCGGLLTAQEGEFTSPGFPQPYRRNGYCTWIIRVDPGNTIRLTFEQFNLDSSPPCSLHYLTVYNGYDETAPLLGRYCGSDQPADVRSSSNVLNVKYGTDASVAGNGFRIRWTTVCGGTFSGLQGTIQSPNWPNSYPHNKVCEYLIEVPSENIVRFTFTAFGLEAADECDFDYVEVYDGSGTSSPMIGPRLCGSNMPNVIMSTGNQMFIKFATDGSLTNLGFQGNFQAAEGGTDGCGRVFNTNHGIITSPGHPNEYPHGVNCSWYINVDPGLIVRLTFSMFSLQNTFWGGCARDYVEIYDNSTMTEESKIGRYCGSAIPMPVTSSENVLTVYMRSDSSVSRGGFSASFVALNASAICGSDLTSPSGVITSPNYPGNYPHDRQCEWTITIASGSQIFVNITDVDIEYHRNCYYDFLEIRNGGFITSPLIQRYCGRDMSAQPIMSHSNRLYIKFKTDHSMTARGFRLEYSSGASGCGGNLTSPNGAIVSPNYPHAYPDNMQCYWLITASRGSLITLFFSDFDIEESGGCHYDYLAIFEGGPTGRSIRRLCGTQLPEPITSSSNKLWLTYRTDAFISGRGFSVHYQSSCNNRLTGNRGVIESPNFPNAYHHRANCTWIIEVGNGNSINISFAAFKLEAGRNGICYYDKLQIRDGGDSSAALLNTFCGLDIPEPISSTGNKLWLNFISDSSVAHEGFRIEWMNFGCGGNLYGSSGIITSPNFPNPYPHSQECEWLITVDTGYSIHFNITTFDLEMSGNCIFDALEIHAGSDRDGPKVASLCHRQTTPQILHVTGTTAFVRFKTDSSVSGTGFNLTYTAVSGGCGGNFSAKTANIMSINYPNNYEHNTECEWNITVPRGQVVVLTFIDFDVEDSYGRNCVYDSVRLYDGPDINSPRIANLCGNTLPNPAVYKSNSNQMFIRMQTDSSVTYRGFKANYTEGCGGTLNADVNGEIISPGYPARYPWNSQCQWIISSAYNTRRVSLTFTHMDLNTPCTDEYVSVSEGTEPNTNVTGAQQGVYCGHVIPHAITSEGSSLTIVFQSSRYYGSRTGFRAVYTSEDATCGAEFTSEAGRFISPNYPNGYPNNAECVWQISTSPGNRVFLSFIDFQLDPNGDVNDDYLEIRSPNVSGQILGRWIHSDPPTNLTALFGAWIKFRSSESTTAPGFLAEYTHSYGGTLQGDSGQVSSPRYPLFYPRNSNYRWTILVSQNMRARLWFDALNLERASGQGVCNYDYVEVFDGTQETGVSLGKFCGSTVPNQFYSSTNEITVVFVSDYGYEDSGFLLNWLAVRSEDVPLPTPSTPPTTPVPGCGGLLNATNTPQNLTSPRYPSDYPNNLDCLWVISAPEGRSVIIRINDILIPGYRRWCYSDYIRIFDGNNMQSPVLGTYCGYNLIVNATESTTNVLAILFHTNSYYTRRGFSLTYQLGCSGQYTMPTGIIQSPEYPSNYPDNQNCTWNVAVLAGKTIKLEFQNNFNIVSSSGCNNDYLQILNGHTAQSPPLFLNGSTTNTDGLYCGTTKPPTLQTSGNYLYTRFASDSSGQGAGFSFTYSTVSVTCGGNLRLTHAVPSGYIQTPNYPQNYPQNVDCSWRIVGPATERIQIDFEDSFSIQQTSECTFNYVEFHDGGTRLSPRIGSPLCGSAMPGTVVSTGNVLFIRFRTDNNATQAGFKAKYSLATCGGRITDASGVITSPAYPGSYGNNQECVWYIVGPVGHYLIFEVTNLNLQYSENCTADFVEIRDFNETGETLRQMCSYPSNNRIESSDSFAYIRFKSDGSGVGNGFRITFRASLEECGGQLTTSTGVITSPNYPGTYSHRRRCVWDITVAMGRRLTLTFSDFRLGPSIICLYDFVQVFNGILQNSPTLGRFCGETIPPTVESSGNTMKVVFGTDSSGSYGGFRATYTSDNEAECGGDYRDINGNITSPVSANGTYSHNIQCLWYLHNSRENGSIRLHFTYMELEYHTSCLFDAVEIREGVDQNGVLVDRLCGNHTSIETLVIPSSNVWIQFRADMSISHSGFQIFYEFTDCGGIYMNPQGVITSPNYPNNYEHNSGCAWRIIAPDGTRIRMNFTDFSFEEHNSCAYDSLTLQNGGFPDSPVIGTYCSTNKPSVFLSQSNEVRLTMRTDFSNTDRGFRMEYIFETGGCGGLYHANQGSISTPNHPSNYPHNTECTWDINVENGYVVVLRFNPPFDLEARNCTNDYVEVFDSLPNGTLISLGKWCQNVEPPEQKSVSTRMVVVFRSDATTNGNGFSATWGVECGGLYTATSGVVYSPGYPRPYPNNLRCNYTIVPGNGHHILLTFTDFEMEGAQYYCGHDSIILWQGVVHTFDYWGYRFWQQHSYETLRYMGRYCSTNKPEPMIIVGLVTLHFQTDGSGQFRGFRAEFSAEECGGEFTDPQGQIMIPHNPSRYINNMNCSWNITVEPGKIIIFEFSKFQLEISPQCQKDSLSFYDGPDTSSNIIGKYCGTEENIPQYTRSSGNQMVINFFTDGWYTSDGFAGSYWTSYGPAHGCGGVLRQSVGTLTSTDANGDGNYEDNLDCEWLIFVGDNKVVTFTVTGLDVENHECRYDYLTVHDGASRDDHQLGKFCGQTIPQSPVVSSSNVILVVFHTDWSISGAGFNATFNETNSMCSGEAFNATTSPQTLSSPNYPSPYGAFIHCSWIIDAGASDKQVRLTVTDLQLQSSPSCSNEYLMYRDVPMGISGQDIKVCGSTIPQTFDSKGQRVRVHFLLAADSTSRGFQLTYQISDCNRNFTATNGRITSPGYPGNYPQNIVCNIQVTAPENTTLAFYFRRFAMEYGLPSCVYDVLEFKNSSSATVARVCGQMVPPPVFVSDNEVSLRFKTDGSVERSGYDITFISSTQGLGCGGNVTGVLSGMFTSPQYPASVDGLMTCSWYITPTAGKSLFWQVSLLGPPRTATADCSASYVVVTYGPGDSNQMAGRFCPNDQTTYIQDTNLQILVQYVTAGNGTGPVFKFEFDKNRAGFRQNSQTIYSGFN